MSTVRPTRTWRPRRVHISPGTTARGTTRGLCALILIESEIGLVAVMPIGMAQVGSVVLSVKPGDYVQKGQELSYFQFGGSDIIMVFQKKANIKFSQELGKHYNFGTAVANATAA